MTIASFLSKTLRMSCITKSRLVLVVFSSSLCVLSMFLRKEMLLVFLLDAMLVCDIESMMLLYLEMPTLNKTEFWNRFVPLLFFPEHTHTCSVTVAKTSACHCTCRVMLRLQESRSGCAACPHLVGKAVHNVAHLTRSGSWKF